jgi:hypothetical protein
MKIAKELKSVCESASGNYDESDDILANEFSDYGTKAVIEGNRLMAIADWQPNTKTDKGYPLISLADNTYGIVKGCLKKFDGLKLVNLEAILPDQDDTLKEYTLIIATFDIHKNNGLVFDLMDLEFIQAIKKDIDIMMFIDNSFILKMYQK